MQIKSLFTSFHTYRKLVLVAILLAVCFFADVSFVMAQSELSQGGEQLAAPTGVGLNPDGDDGMDVIAGAAADLFGQLVYPLAHTIGMIILGLGGTLLDMAIRNLIIGMGGLLNGDYGNNLKQIWEIIRDVFNLAFIFSFIFLGIRTILNAEDSGTKRALGHLIVAALFINFSLFISLAIIDFTNIMATQIYNQLIYVGVSGTDNDTALINMNGSIAGAFMEAASIGSFFGEDSSAVHGMNLVFYSIFMMLFFIITGIIFLFATYHVVYRFVALGLYIILSPALFLGYILPNFKKYSDMWLQGLLRQSFFAPAFMFLLYVSLQVLTTLKARFGGIEGEGFTTILKGADMTTDGFSIFFFFALSIGFLYASVKVGDMMGIAGAKTSLGALTSLRKGIQNTAYMPLGWGLNKFGVGGLDRLNQAAEADKASFGRLAARSARLLVGGKSGSESARAAVEKASNYGGRDARQKAEKAVEQRAARGHELQKITHAIDASMKKPTDLDLRMKMEKAVQGASSAQMIELIKEGEKDKVKSVAGELSESQFKAIMDDKEIDDATKNSMASARATQIEKRLIDMNNKQTLEEVIGKADTSELKALGFETAYKHAGLLSAKQIEDWKDLTPTEKTRLKEQRKNQLIDEYGRDPITGAITGSNAAALFSRIPNDEERSKLPSDILKNNAAAEYLNKNVLTKIVDNPGLSAVDRATIKTEVLVYHQNRPTYNDYVDFFSRNNAGQRY